MGFNRHTHPPPLPRILKIVLNVKEKGIKKENNIWKLGIRGGGPTNIFRGLRVL